MGSTQFGNFNVSRGQWVHWMGHGPWVREADRVGWCDNRTFVETRPCLSAMCVTFNTRSYAFWFADWISPCAAFRQG